MSIQELRIVQT